MITNFQSEILDNTKVIEKTNYHDYIVLPYYYELSYDNVVMRNFDNLALLSCAINVHLGITDLDLKQEYWDFARVKDKCRNYVCLVITNLVDKISLIDFLDILFENGTINKLILFSRYQNIWYNDVYIPGNYAVDILMNSNEDYKLLENTYLYIDSHEEDFHERIYLATLEHVYQSFKNCIFYFTNESYARKWKLTNLGNNMYTVSWYIDTYMLSNYRNESEFLYSILYDGCIRIGNNEYCSYEELFESFKALK